MSQLVTGEAVVLEMRPARPATRALALGIDLALQVTLLFVPTVPIAAVLPAVSTSLSAGLSVVALVIVFVGYSTTIETLTRGKSVGKYALGLRVVRDDGGSMRFRQALARALAGSTVDFLMSLGVVGFTVAMLSAKGKRVGDLLAGTVVIRERAPSSGAPVPAIPAQLHQWAFGLELSQLPNQLALAARSYLTRYYELRPEVRDAMGAHLASSVAQYVSPAPPPGTPAWAYLAAVLAERHRRAVGTFHHPDGWPADPPSVAPDSTTRLGAEHSAPEHSPREHPAPEHRAPEHPAPEHRAPSQPASEESAAGPWPPEPPAPPGADKARPDSGFVPPS